MTATLKAFVTITDLIQNTPYVISPLGELSSYSQTFSRDRRDFVDAAYPSLMLNVFKSKNIDNTSFAPGTLLVKQCLKMAAMVRQVVLDNSLISPYNPLDFVGFLQGKFDPTTELSNITIGNFVTSTSPTIHLDMPEWISWTSNLTASSDTIKIWLSDAAFRLEYDEYEIYSVPAFIDPVTYFSGFATLTTALQALKMSEYLGRVTEAKQTYPETIQVVVDLTYIDPVNNANTLSIPFVCLIYGPLGNEVASLLRAILQNAIDTSTYTVQQWITIFPQLAQSDEFAIIPMWNKVAVPNIGNSATLYKSLLPVKATVDFAKANFNIYTYGVGLIDDHVHMFTSQYQELVCVVIDCNGNSVSNTSFSNKYPDYTDIPTSDINFMRMTAATRNFVLTLEHMLLVAETYVNGSTVPADFRVITRGGTVFIGCVIDFVQHLVAVKSNTAYL